MESKVIYTKLSKQLIESYLKDIMINPKKMGTHPNEIRRFTILTGRRGLKSVRHGLRKLSLKYHIKVLRFKSRHHKL